MWYTVARLSDHMDLTPEGFLLVRDVPIARCGTQMYRFNEIADIDADDDGWIAIDRDPSEVFRPESVASFTGKPIVNDHPFQGVGPENWSDLAVGLVQFPRRGENADHDLLKADLLFTTKRGIDLVRGGKRALSVGYDALYERIGRGLGRQYKIICNHVALVDEGRCGERCTIMDGKALFNPEPWTPLSDKTSDACCDLCEEGTRDAPRPRRSRVRLHVWQDRALVYDEFVESEHPRVAKGSEGGGEFTKGGTAAHASTKVVNGKRVTEKGEDLPEHITKLKIPPAWTDVTYSPHPDSHLLATGRDVKGRRQAVYSAAHSAAQAAAKFARIKELAGKFNKIRQANEKARQSTDQKTADAADATALIMHTGIRPGSETDTKAEKQAYGATTLQGQHVVKTKDGVSLQFTGKKGVPLNIPVTDPDMQKMLLRRKQAAGSKGQLFGVNERALLDHVHSFGSFKTKDFRTLVGTQTAMDEVKKVAAPADAKEYKRAVMTVAKAVSQKLGNTPTIALQSYINPAVFAQWQQRAGITADAAPDPEDDMLDAHWGEVGKEWPDDDDDDPDDEQLDPTPEDVVAALGFDPADEDDDDTLTTKRRKPVHLHIHSDEPPPDDAVI